MTQTTEQLALKYWDCIVPGKLVPDGDDADMEDLTKELVSQDEEGGESEMTEEIKTKEVGL